MFKIRHRTEKENIIFSGAFSDAKTATLTPFDNIPDYKTISKFSEKKINKVKQNKFSGDEEFIKLYNKYIPKNITVEEPEIRVNHIYEAIPIPASNIILKGDVAGHHSFFDPSVDVCMAERFNDILIDPRSKKMAYRFSGQPVRMSEALSLHGQCAGNYAHFLCEVLPRLLIFDNAGISKSAPILLDDGWLHPNHIKLVKIFNRERREIIRVGRNHPAFVHHLFDVSPTAYAPPEYRWFVEGKEMQATPSDVYRFSKPALDLVRNFDLDRKLMDSPYGEKIFLSRKVNEHSTGRDLPSKAHLEKIASLHGFEVVNTSEMGVLEQIALFRAAKVVVAPIGASMANLIFTPPGCKIICLSPIYKNANYYYFSKLMSVLGHDLTYIVGPQIDGPSHHPFHKNYHIDCDDFYEQLAQLA